ncbi:MAG: DUF296 domain-containing protein [Methanolinea sp.]|nr:DUF296 domain-containing protein [Methanolinea sp.]
MQYAEGKTGRIFLLRIDHGEDLLVELEKFSREKEIRCATIQILGALREGKLVTGPEVPVLPPVPHFEEVSGGWEILGIASLFWGDQGPQIHLHTAIGRGKQALTGCLRVRGEVYLVIEAIITEILGIDARRIHDPGTGLSLPRFGPGQPG